VPLLLVGELLRPEIPTVSPHESLDSVLDKFSRTESAALPVTAPGDEEEITGLVTRQAVMATYREELNKAAG
jgi:CBS domain-containing protein